MIVIYRYVVLLIILSLAMISRSYTASAQSGQINTVLNGAVDLSFVDKPIDSISLEGEWEFYKNQLLTPEQIALSVEKPDYIQVTIPWEKQRVEDQLLTQVKYGTYRLRLKLAASEVGQQKAIYMSDIASAYKVWVDGTMLGGIGTVGKTILDEVPKSRAKLIFFEPERVDVDIIIQASNYTSRNEGTFRAIYYGNADILMGHMITDQLTSMLTIGGLLVIGLYHLIIYGMRRMRWSDRSTLYIGLLAVDIGVRGWIKSTYLVDLIAPSIGWEAIVKVDYITGYVAYLLIVMLMKQMYPQEMNRTMAMISHVLIVLFCLYIIVTPATVYTQTLSTQFAIMLIISLNTVGYVCISAIKRRREGALINMIGYIIIAAACINDVMLYQRMIETTELLYGAIFLFILLQAIIISYRYSQLFQYNLVLTTDLMQLNQTLEHKVKDRTADLYRKNDELIHMQHSRAEMMANISHDMGSPITGIQMNMQILKDGLSNPEQQPHIIQSLLDKAAQIKRLNNDLFELSVLELGQFSFQFKQIPLRSYMDDIVRRLTKDLANEHIQLQVENMDTMLDNREVWVNIDTLRIKQVLDNYVGNAIKFSDGDSSTIVLNCRIVHANDNNLEPSYYVVIEVKDQGSGISHEDLPYVFERFYRKAEGHVSGSGMGLAIVKEIAEQHHGRVDVVSKLGEGSTFSLSLPVYLN